MSQFAPQPPGQASGSAPGSGPAWYAAVSCYEWLVLAIASAGWIFDAFEGQIFNITRNQLLGDILGRASDAPAIQRYGDIFLGVFLTGGTVGGVFFGWLGDRFGRRPTLMLTILMYSLFSGLTYFADALWEVGVLRFLVAMGVGGEWAVAATLVAEVFPQKARAYASGIFHSSSNVGTWMAALAGLAVGAQWRYAYLLGVIPALLILWVRTSVKEPETWLAAKQKAVAGLGARLGSFRDLLLNPVWGRRALLGMLLVAVGLGTFWGVTVAGQDLARDMLLRTGVLAVVAAEKAKFAYGIVEAVGAGVGMLSFGPVSVWLGRKRAFVVFQLCALLAAKAGATYISPFVGRLDAVCHDGMELVRQIKAIYDNYGFPTQIITAAVRHPQHVLQAALAGSHVATMGFDILEQLYQHPLTDVVMDTFLKDWAKIPNK